ncbi:hypothetical protein PVAND_009345 [Polypedilum vanderplanki]|uniref:Receptor L-domain domain-containing protein n=1 Tax=Polypedilum vanderplanki TaxID=319348 RepID=A0A9J6CCV4_POLVA|nr:hypothetical protein PVAND_009345 [Polypedilum vanderplanki]
MKVSHLILMVISGLILNCANSFITKKVEICVKFETINLQTLRYNFENHLQNPVCFKNLEHICPQLYGITRVLLDTTKSYINELQGQQENAKDTVEKTIIVVPSLLDVNQFLCNLEICSDEGFIPDILVLGKTPEQSLRQFIHLLSDIRIFAKIQQLYLKSSKVSLLGENMVFHIKNKIIKQLDFDENVPKKFNFYFERSKLQITKEGFITLNFILDIESTDLLKYRKKEICGSFAVVTFVMVIIVWLYKKYRSSQLTATGNNVELAEMDAIPSRAAVATNVSRKRP